MRGLGHDLRTAARALRRSPVFTAVAIGCLAIGIAVNAAAFSVLDALLVRDFPGVRRQHELNTILLGYEAWWGRSDATLLSPLDWDGFRDGIPGFSSSSVAGRATVAVRLESGAVAARADFVSGEFFAMLGTQPAAGRLLTSDDDVPGAPPVAVIGHALWRESFGARPDVIGQPLMLGTVSFTIVGVAPPGFVGLYPGELGTDPELGAPFVFLPLVTAPLIRAESRYASTADALADRWLLYVGRRLPGISTAQIETQANAVGAALASAHPRHRANATAAVRGPSAASTAELMGAFTFTMAVPLLILLVACANLANQLLARAVHREREIAVRLSLGATRARVVRLLLVESTLVAAAAGVLGVLLARVLTDALRAYVLIVPFRIPVDWRVALFATALALVTALAFGLVPALHATRLDLAQTMKEGASMGGRRRSRLRGALIVSQVATSVTLLALAAVFVRASQRSHVSERAANIDRLLTTSVDLNLLGYSPTAGRAFQEAALERLAALPGVEAVALAAFGPASSIPPRRVALAGDAPERQRWFEVASVEGDWLGARGWQPLAGRGFTAAERLGGAPVVVVDEVVARRLWPDGSALGQTLRIGEGADAPWATVIGIIPTVRDRHMHNDDGVIVVPSRGEYVADAFLYIRTAGHAADLRVAVREVIRQLDPAFPPPAVVTLRESLEELATPVTQLALGVGTLGIVALLLAALGLSAVLAFMVEQRRREMALRIALGARSAAVTALVLRQSLGLTLLGVMIGIPVAAAAATVLRGVLFGLPPIDPMALAGAIAIIVMAALLCSAWPARQAVRADPMLALRAD